MFLPSLFTSALLSRTIAINECITATGARPYSLCCVVHLKISGRYTDLPAYNDSSYSDTVQVLGLFLDVPIGLSCIKMHFEAVTVGGEIGNCNALNINES